MAVPRDTRRDEDHGRGKDQSSEREENPGEGRAAKDPTQEPQEGNSSRGSAVDP